MDRIVVETSCIRLPLFTIFTFWLAHFDRANLRWELRYSNSVLHILIEQFLARDWDGGELVIQNMVIYILNLGCSILYRF